MKKLLVIIGLFTLLSCEEDTGIANTSCLLSSVESDEFLITVSYDESQKVQSVNINANGHTRETVFAYQGNNIDKISIRENGVPNVDDDYAFEYSDDKLVKASAKYKVEPGLTELIEMRFFYENEKVIRIERWGKYLEDDLSEFEILEMDEITYQGENVSKIKYHDYEEVDNELRYEENFTYDANPNPLYGDIAFYIGGLVDNYAVLFSRNNVITEQTIRDEENENLTTWEYTYSDLNLPLSIQRSPGEHPSGNKLITSLTYEGCAN